MDSRLFAFIALAFAFCLVVIADLRPPLLAEFDAVARASLDGIESWWRPETNGIAILCVVVAIVALRIRLVCLQCAREQISLTRADQLSEIRLVAVGLLANLFASLAGGVLAALFAGWLAGSTVLASAWDWKDGRATLGVGLITLGIAVFGYLLRSRRNQLHAAKALLTEIQCKHRGNLRSAGVFPPRQTANWAGAVSLVSAEPKVTPLVSALETRSEIMEAQTEFIGYLPIKLIESIVDFYGEDQQFSAGLSVMSAAPFADASVDRRAAYVRNVERYWTSDYLPIAERAILRLSLYYEMRRRLI